MIETILHRSHPITPELQEAGQKAYELMFNAASTRADLFLVLDYVCASAIFQHTEGVHAYALMANEVHHQHVSMLLEYYFTAAARKEAAESDGAAT